MINTTNPIYTLETFYDENKKVKSQISENLSKINTEYSKNKDFVRYKNDIQKCFGLSPAKINKNCRFYLAGFIEGEGSINVSVKKTLYGSYKLLVDPEFSITQHINGISNLYLALCIFQTGRIRYKMGSNATFVYTIDNRRSLNEKVIPFYEKYINAYGSLNKKERLQTFKQILHHLNQKDHLNINKMLYEILPLWHKMRMQVGQVNQTFKSLEQAQDYVYKNSPHQQCSNDNS
jgi:hypothetical protein